MKKSKATNEDQKSSKSATANSKFEKPLVKPIGKLGKNASQAPIKKSNKSRSDEDAKDNFKPKTNEKKNLKRKKDFKTGSGNDPKKPKLEELTVKERKEQRKSTKANYDIGKKAKQLWDLLRREDCPKAKQIELSNEVYDLIKGKVLTLLYAHDTVRVIECLMICGTPEIRSALFEEAKNNLLPLMKSKYSKFFVMKILKYGTKEQRDFVMKAMHRKVVKLVLHTEASEVVEYAYNEFANVNQRNQLFMEFYGPSFALFKDKVVGSLQQVLENEPKQKDVILEFMKSTINNMLEKNIFNHSIVHRVLLEYIRACGQKDREELIASIREKLVEILHTKDGSRVGLHCIWHGTSKDRKIILKSMKSHCSKICMEESGHILLLAIFDCVDDTKLIQKTLLEEILSNGLELALHSTARKVLFYLIAPRSTRYFHPDVIKILSQGDGNPNSKKDSSLRSQELLTAASQSFIKLAFEHFESLISCPQACLLLQAIIEKCQGDFTELFTKIASMASKPLVINDGQSDHIVENGASHRVLKSLIKLDKERAQNNENANFCEILLNEVSDESLQSWVECNRGAFILLLLIESESMPVIRRIHTALSSIMGTIKKKKSKGAELLYMKLKSINE